MPPVRVITLDDGFPETLLDALHDLPSDDDLSASTQNLEISRPAKRIRLEYDAIDTEYIPIGRGEVMINRHQPEPTGVKLPFVRKHVSQHLGLNALLATENDMAQLRLFSNGKPKGHRLNEVVYLDEGSYGRDLIGLCPQPNRARTCDDRDLDKVVNLGVSFDTETSQVTIKVSFEVRWKCRRDFREMTVRKPGGLAQEIVNLFIGKSPVVDTLDVAWSPRDFYNAAYVPDKYDTDAHGIQVDGLRVDLFPFQKRALKWLLAREGVQWQHNRGSGPAPMQIPPLHSEEDELPLSFRRATDADGNEIYTSDLFNIVTDDLGIFRMAEAVKGGILAEEMGLGKTVEILSLILLHRRDGLGATLEDPTPTKPARASTTLIVTPQQLLQQWMAEMASHAPELKVLYYKGSRINSRDEEVAVIKNLASHDVVVTTYSVLASELWSVEQPPSRSRRQERAYYRPTSPLVQMEWWRICLDEAQLVDGGSRAAESARLLPRVNSWAISGTPVRRDVQDLRGLLVFLQIAPYSWSRECWNALISRHRSLFRKLFNKLALRHTKPMVRHEIKLPHQNRYVITLPFNNYEELEYRDLFQRMARECGMDLNGRPLDPESWDVDLLAPVLSRWLRNLRLYTINPFHGLLKNAARGKKWEPKTEADVLQLLYETADADVQTKRFAYLNLRLRRGMLLENGPRVGEALDLWQSVKQQASDAAEEFEKALVLDQKKLDEGEQNEGEGDEDQEEGINPLVSKVNDDRRKLRQMLDLKHKAAFCCGNAYFQMREKAEITEPGSEEIKRLQELEDGSYEEAKQIRQALLAETHAKAVKLMDQIREKANQQSFVAIAEIMPHPERGIETGGPAFDKMANLCEAFNDQTEMLDDMRESMVGDVLQPLLDEGDDGRAKTGEEWQESIDIQGRLEAHVKVLEAAISDREDAINGTTNLRVDHELKVARQEATSLVEASEATQEHKTLLALDEVRRRFKPVAEQLGSLRSSVSTLRQLHNALGSSNTERARVESEMAKRQLTHMARQSSEQSDIVKSLRTELGLFSGAVKARMEFYNHLQDISDSLNPYEGPKDAPTEARWAGEEQRAEKDLQGAKMKERYFEHLIDTGGKTKETPCVICGDPYEEGTCTSCGHVFCSKCLLLWWRAHRNCPMCKKALNSTDLFNFSHKKQEMELREDFGPGICNHPGLEARNSIYSEFSLDKLEAIKAIKLPGGIRRSSKIDMIMRHVLWLRQADPGSKSIIFSSFPSIAESVEHLLTNNDIRYTSMKSKNGVERFRDDPAVEVFVLSAQAHASGLNLVEANHVFLCEPLLNTPLELQAIARVDRIGQKHETNVWLYLVKGTVEESIYNLSVSRRMQHMGAMTKGKGTQDLESAREEGQQEEDETIDEANRVEIESSRLNKLLSRESEVVNPDDFVRCLFGAANASRDQTWADEEAADDGSAP